MQFDKSDLLSVYLTEYNALRDEILQIMKWRDSLVFVSLAISGATFSFVYNDKNVGEANNLALYILTPLSCLAGALWLVNTYRMRRVGAYISSVLSVQIKTLFPDNITNGEEQHAVEIFNWQTSKRLEFHRRHRFAHAAIYFTTFCASGILAQYLLIKDFSGNFFEVIKSMDYPFFYVFNYCILLIVCWYFFSFIFKART